VLTCISRPCPATRRIGHHRPLDVGQRQAAFHLARFRLGLGIDVAVQQRIGGGLFLQRDLVAEVLQEGIELR
jgi:hypothetical protein